MFIKKGKKKLITKHTNFSLLQIKLAQNVNPLIYLFEIVDSITPTFKLENIFPRKLAVIYPKAVNKGKRYNVAIK